MDVYFYVFQCKKSRWFLLRVAFVSCVGNAGDPHIPAILHIIPSLSETELGRQFLTCSAVSGTPFPPTTALLCWASQAWDIFLVDFVPFSFLPWNAALWIRDLEMWLQWAPKFQCLLIPGGVWNRLLWEVGMSHRWKSSRPGWMWFGAIWDSGRFPWQGVERDEL